MQLDYNQDQQDFQRAVRAFLERHRGLAELPGRVGADDAGETLWRAMADQLGLQGLTIAEVYGGGGYGAIELGLVLAETGRVLDTGPLFSTVALGATALSLAEDAEVREEFLPGIAGGGLTAALALAEPGDRGGRYHVGAVATASASSAAHRLRGTKTCVYDGALADVLVVAARDSNGPALFVLRGDAEGVARRSLETLDPTRPQAEIVLDDAVATRLGGGELLETVLVRAAAALAAEQVGGAESCLETAVSYAKNRSQFGRPIGSFQAIKHLCADVLMSVECARTATWLAAWECDHPTEGLRVAAATAQHAASEAYTFASRSCIQVLGGIGFTWEHPAHLHFKRAIASDQFLGTSQDQLTRIAELALTGSDVGWPESSDGGIG